MSKTIDGICFLRDNDCAVCHVELFSEELQNLLRKKLSTICHGSCVADYKDSRLLGYEATLEAFVDRYKSKTPMTQIGMIGELISHTILPEFFEDFEVASAFFNMEEKSIRKGFDLILYRSVDSSVWITEVKSGSLHQGKDHDGTALDLLESASSDLYRRLNEQEPSYWLNAIKTVRASVSDSADYKKVLASILDDYGGDAATKIAASNDKSVVLVASLFEPISSKVQIKTASSFHRKVSSSKRFSKAVVLCMQKSTYQKVADFLEQEAAGSRK